MAGPTLYTDLPKCPRCGYDQRGLVSTWTDQCPLHGRCVECGLDFEWINLFDPDRWRLPGLVEHAKGPRVFLNWAARTWVWTLLPWVFWGRVQLHHRVRPWGLAAWLALLIVVPHVLNAGLEALGTLFNPWASSRGWSHLDALTMPIANLSGPWGRLPAVEWRIGDWPASAQWLAGLSVLWPLTLGLMPISLTRASVRWGHVCRATVFAASVPASYFAFETLCKTAWLCVLTWGQRGQSQSLYDAYQAIDTFRDSGITFIIDAGLVWLAVWWLVVLTKGWKLRHGWIVWLLLLVLVAAICAACTGVEVTLFGRVYRL